MNWTVEETGPCVATIRIDAQRKASWEQWGLLTSDRHVDNPKSNHRLQRRHLDEAKARGAFILDCGDLFCAMQGAGDKRAFKPDLKEENKQGDYLGSLVRSGLDLFGEYKDNLAVLGTGNHESAVLKKSEFDLTGALVERLRDRGSRVVRGGYRGWVRLLFQSGKSGRYSTNLYYTHGGGGGGEVTKGVIKTNRRAVYLPDADIIIGGHIHEAWYLELSRSRLSSGGVEYSDDQTHVCLPTYKEEFIGSAGGYHHEKERPPKPLGAWWVRFFWDTQAERFRHEFHRAK